MHPARKDQFGLNFLPAWRELDSKDAVLLRDYGLGDESTRQIGANKKVEIFFRLRLHDARRGSKALNVMGLP